MGGMEKVGEVFRIKSFDFWGEVFFYREGEILRLGGFRGGFFFYFLRFLEVVFVLE